MTFDSTPAITLPVRDLENAKQFYLAALRPIGYHIISYTQHKLADRASDSYSFGPVNTRRVDLTISQSPRSARQTHSGKQPRICFVAVSASAVEDFYAAASNWGGASVTSPRNGQRGYMAAVHDPEGNHVEVAFRDAKPAPAKDVARVPSPAPAPAPAPAKSSIQRWRENVADEKGVMPAPVPLTESAPSVVSSSRASGTSRRTSSRRTASPPASKANSGIDPKRVIGAVAAGTAATTLVMEGAKYIIEEVTDNRGKEAKLNRQTSRRSNPSASPRSTPRTKDDPTVKRLRRRSNEDRDSGYSSIASAARGLPSWSGARSTSDPHRQPSSSSRRPPVDTPSQSSRPRASTGTSSRPPATRTSDPQPPRSHITVSQAPSKPLPLSFRRPASRGETRPGPAADRDGGNRSRSHAPAVRRTEYVIPERESRRGAGSRTRMPSGKAASRTSGTVGSVRTVLRAPGGGRKGGREDDADTVVPGDSISQVSFGDRRG